MNLKIKILKTTPFDLEGNTISFEEFKKKYGYISMGSKISDSELVKYLLQERKCVLEERKVVNRNNSLGTYFEVELYVDYAPSLFMYQDDLFTREGDIWYSMLGTTKITLSREDVLIIVNTCRETMPAISVYRD